MLGIVFDASPWEDWVVMLLPFAIAMVILVWMIIRRGNQSRPALIAQRVVIGLLIGVFVLLLLLPSVERTHREYYKGKDQFQWLAQLRSGDKPARHEAILALGEILKAAKSSQAAMTRYWVAQELTNYGREARIILPVLAELLERNDDGILHERLKLTIQQTKAATGSRVPIEFDSSIGPELSRLGAHVIWDSQDPDRPGVNVELTGHAATDEALKRTVACLKEWEAVETLDLGYGHVTDQGLECLTELTHLKSLSLACIPITNAGLKHVGQMPNLQMLWLTKTQIGNDGLSYLGQLSDLRVLFLVDTHVTDAGLTKLQGLTKLRLLWLTDLPISDAGLSSLSHLSLLENLNLASTKVTDAGLKNLVPLKALRVVNVFNTGVTEEGIVRLREMLPTLEVYH